MSLCGIPELELEAPDWLLLDGFVLWLLDDEELDEGLELWSVELEGEVALPEVEGEVLCELLEDDGDELDDGELRLRFRQISGLLIVEHSGDDLMAALRKRGGSVAAEAASRAGNKHCLRHAQFLV